MKARFTRTTLLLILILSLLSGCAQAVVPVSGGEPQEVAPSPTPEVSETVAPTEPVATEAPTEIAAQTEPPVEIPAATEIPQETVSDPVPDTSTFLVFLPAIRSLRQSAPDPINVAGAGWTTVAGNPQRTSWVPEEVSGNLRAEWFVPIEAYIPQNVQLIASDGLIFVSTARGLYALNATNGQLSWRFDTELPLGNSPTVSNGVVYVGGYDRRLYALRASNGQLLWSYDGADAGYSANPLVVDGRVIVGNRDGGLYAIGAEGSANAGRLLWKFQAGGMIDLSAAYKDGVIYFAANDNYAYAVNASNGSQVWKSGKLPGDGYQSYWPVIYGDQVVFSAASGYRTGANPGTSSLRDASNNAYGKIFDIERDEIFAGLADMSLIGASMGSQDWANGKTVLDGSRLINYLENKPYRRVIVALNRSNGSEFTFDSDRDGKAEYLPVAMWGTHSGNRFPPIVGPDGILYVSNLLQKASIPQGRVMGWLHGTPYLSQVGGQGAVDEPQALSMGGQIIYRNLCCDRVGDFFRIDSNRSGSFWTYNNPLPQQIPNYDQMWYGMDPEDTVRLRGNYGTQNGVYHNHGDQNPLIPYNGRLYVHRSNAIIAYGPGLSTQALNPITIQSPDVTGSTLSETELKSRLEAEVQKIVSAGHLRPGYYNGGQFGNYSNLGDYFDNPGETLYTLSLAYPHLSAGLQSQVRTYLQTEYNTYFKTTMYARIGWATGAAREDMPIPNDIQANLANLGASVNSESRWSWAYPPFNFYALWKYVQIVPGEALTAYNQARSRLAVPVPAGATNSYLQERPYELNAYIAGYFGFLRLQELAGRSAADSQLRTQVTNEYNRLVQLRSSTFSKDTPYVDGYGSYHLRTMNVARNFLFLTPELADTLGQNANTRVTAAVNEYKSTAPYWFVTRFNAVVNEGVRENLYDAVSIFGARAMIQNESQAELSKWIDVPAFGRGDLYYLQNLVRAIEAP